MFETLDYTIRIGSTPTFLYFDLYLYSAYADRQTGGHSLLMKQSFYYSRKKECSWKEAAEMKYMERWLYYNVKNLLERYDTWKMTPTKELTTKMVRSFYRYVIYDKIYSHITRIADLVVHMSYVRTNTHCSLRSAIWVLEVLVAQWLGFDSRLWLRNIFWVCV